MLNDYLYNALKRAFKKVGVTNEGAQARIEYIPGTVSDWRIPEEEEHGEQYSVNCPFCKDRKQHLYISYLSYAQPLKNGTLLRVGGLRAQCFRNGCLKYTENRDYLEGLIGQAMLAINNGTMPVNAIECNTDAEDGTAKFQTSPEVTLEGIQSWVPDFQYCDENTNPDIIDYLIERGVTQEDIDWLKVGWGPIRSPRTYTYLNDQLPWVIFPIIMNGKLRGVQARCPSKFLESGGIKYWFHPGFRKRTVVMNIDQARSIGVGVLCEGIFDVLKIGKPGVCVFGHTPSSMQSTLLTTIGKGLIWCPDTEVNKQADPVAVARKQIKMWNDANVFPKGAHLVILPAKDPGDMERMEIWAEIVKQVPAEMQDHLLQHVITKV